MLNILWVTRYLSTNNFRWGDRIPQLLYEKPRESKISTLFWSILIAIQWPVRICSSAILTIKILGNFSILSLLSSFELKTPKKKLVPFKSWESSFLLSAVFSFLISFFLLRRLFFASFLFFQDQFETDRFLNFWKTLRACW